MTTTTAVVSWDAPTDGQIAELADGFRVRSVQMADRAGSGHPTSSMSAADLIAVLVARHLRIEPDRPDEPGNDGVIFSKGHASPLLYTAFESMGMLDGALGGFDDLVDAYRRHGSIRKGHPTPRLAGVPAPTGALGPGLSTSDELGKHGKPLDDPASAIEQLGGSRYVRVVPPSMPTWRTRRGSRPSNASSPGGSSRHASPSS
jgi:hypothetical protein